MATLAIRGNNERAEDIARLFKDLGAQGEYSPCSDESYLYYIAHDKKVVYIIDQPDNIYRNLLFNVYTIEEFEAKFPYRVGDKVAYDEYYSTKEPPVEQVAHIKYMSWSCNHSDVCYTMENGTKRGVDEIRKVEPRFVPKDGDVVWAENGLSIFKKWGDFTLFYSYFTVFDTGNVGDRCYGKFIREYIRPATEEEKKKLFDKLAEEGYEWDAEERKLVKLKWKPEEGKRFWFPIYGSATITFEPMLSLFNKGRDKVFLEKGWCFKNEEECQGFCDLLNDAINQVEP